MILFCQSFRSYPIVLHSITGARFVLKNVQVNPHTANHVWREKYSLIGIGLCLVCIFLYTACGGGDPTKSSNRKVEAFSLIVEQHTLPDDLAKDNTLTVNSIEGLGTLIGVKSGLYILNGKKFNILDQEQPTVGIEAWKSKYLVIARPKFLQVYDGSIHRLNVNEEFSQTEKEEDKTITSIAVQKEAELWVGTKNQLWLIVGNDVAGFNQFGHVEHLSTFLGAEDLLVKEQGGSFKSIRAAAASGYDLRDFSKSELSLTQLVPSFGGKLWGVAAEGLYEWRKEEDKSAWWAYQLVTEEGQDAAKVEYIAQSSLDGTLWVVTKDKIFQIGLESARYAERPKELKTIISASASYTGDLWLNDGTSLFHITVNKSGPITYKDHVKPFFDKNCLRCHGDVGPGRPINSYELTKTYIQDSIKAIENESMPADKKPLVGGDISLLKKWVEEGLKP